MSLNDFKWKYFAPSITLCIRSYNSISLSYADVSDILAERGIFHHSATYCYFIE